MNQLPGGEAAASQGSSFSLFALLLCIPGVMMRDRPDTDADLGTLPDGDRGFSGVSSWWAMRRDAPRLKDGLVPVLLLRSRMRRRLDTTPSKTGKMRLQFVFLLQIHATVWVGRPHLPPRRRWPGEA